jgi:hypothetical protein
MKLSYLAATACLALSLSACGDDSPSAPTTSSDSNEPQSSAAVETSSTSPDSQTGSSDSATQNPTESSSSVALQPESSAATPVDPYAVGTDVDEPSYKTTCTVKPLENGNGDAVYCDTTYAGPIFYDTDESAYDPTAADFGSTFVSINKVFASLKADDKVVFVLRHADRQASSGRTSHLTDVGIYQARSVGERLHPPKAPTTPTPNTSARAKPSRTSPSAAEKPNLSTTPTPSSTAAGTSRTTRSTTNTSPRAPT